MVKSLSKYAILMTSIVFIVAGLFRNEHMVVLKKAIRVCLECIGVG